MILSVDAHQPVIPSTSEWNQDPKTQSIGRVVCIPEEPTIAEGLRVVGEHPKKLECGAEFPLASVIVIAAA